MLHVCVAWLAGRGVKTPLQRPNTSRQLTSPLPTHPCPAWLPAGAQLGPANLFFGCRTRKADFIYQGELEGAVAEGALSQLHVAFSREGE